jgi:hypothetical protein
MMADTPSPGQFHPKRRTANRFTLSATFGIPFDRPFARALGFSAGKIFEQLGTHYCDFICRRRVIYRHHVQLDITIFEPLTYFDEFIVVNECVGQRCDN